MLRGAMNSIEVSVSTHSQGRQDRDVSSRPEEIDLHTGGGGVVAAELHGHRHARAAGEQHWHGLVLLRRHTGRRASVRVPSLSSAPA